MSVPAHGVQQLLFDQALHGYDDGHRLLKTSALALSAGAQRLLLLMSDLSGPQPASGFDGYLTGYPLPGEAIYAFARTWYAPEMSRPGCVWTHTLLIKFHDLAQINDLALLTVLFRRPGLDSSLYVDRVRFDALTDPPFPGTGIDEVRTATIMETLYGTSERGVALPAPAEAEVAPSVLAIWSQQWPALRRTFSFCTGALAPRQIEKRPLDLQVYPDRNRSYWRSRANPSVYVLLEGPEQMASITKWARRAAREIASGSEQLQRFLLRYGPDVPQSRAAFAVLAEIFDAVSTPSRRGAAGIRSAAELVAREFPKVTDAPRLKLDLFGGGKRTITPASETQVLIGLGTARKTRAFDADALELRDRAARLWGSDRLEALSTISSLIEGRVNGLGEVILDGFADAASTSDLITCPFEVVYVLIARRPVLATTAAIWERSPDEQGALLDAVLKPRRLRVGDEVALVHALLTAQVDLDPPQVLERFGGRAIAAVLSWVDETQADIGGSWRVALGANEADAAAWLRDAGWPQPPSLRLLAKVLDPRASYVREIGSERWLPLLEPLRRGELDTPTLAFLFVIGSRSTELAGAALVASAVAPLHAAAADGKLGSDAWLILRDDLPSLPWWQEWDRCEKLRRATAEAFRRNDWPSDELRAHVDPELAARIETRGMK